MKKIIAFSALSLFFTVSGLAQANANLTIKNDSDGNLALSKTSYCDGNPSATDAFPKQIAAHHEQSFVAPPVTCTIAYTIPHQVKDFFINTEPGKKPICIVNTEKGNALTCAVSAVGKDDYQISLMALAGNQKLSSIFIPPKAHPKDTPSLNAINDTTENTALENVVPQVNVERVHKAATEAAQFVEGGITQMIDISKGSSPTAIAQKREIFMRDFNKRYSNLNSTEVNQVVDIASDDITQFINIQAKAKSRDSQSDTTFMTTEPKGDNSRDDVCSKDITWAFSSVNKGLDILQKTELDTKTIGGIWVGLASVAMVVIVDTTSGISPNYGIGKPRGCNHFLSGLGRGILTLTTYALDWELSIPNE